MTDRPEWKYVIGILGGLGPHAHVELEILLLSATARALGRDASDQDYPPWVLSSLPSTPDRTGALLSGGESPVEAMVKSAERLAGADFAVIPCNTAHAFLNDVRSRVSIPILDMIRVTAERAAQRVGSKATVGILAVSGTLRSGIYEERFREVAPEIRLVTPFDLKAGDEMQERLVMEPIFGPLRDGRRVGGGIKSGAFRDPKRREELVRPLSKAARLLQEEGAALVLTACTEIPLVLGRDTAEGVPLLDPMEVAAETSIEIALGRRPLPG